MSEPSLEEIEDYNELKGSKKKVVWGVVIAAVIASIVYVSIYKIYDDESDKLPVQQSIKSIPLK